MGSGRSYSQGASEVAVSLWSRDPTADLSAMDRKTAELVGEAAALAALKFLQTIYSSEDAADIAVDVEEVAKKAVAFKLRKR